MVRLNGVSFSANTQSAEQGKPQTTVAAKIAKTASIAAVGAVTSAVVKHYAQQEGTHLNQVVAKASQLVERATLLAGATYAYVQIEAIQPVVNKMNPTITGLKDKLSGGRLESLATTVKKFVTEKRGQASEIITSLKEKVKVENLKNLVTTAVDRLPKKTKIAAGVAAGLAVGVALVALVKHIRKDK